MRSTNLSIKKKTGAFIGAGVLVVAAAGAAFAYWSTTGSGSGSATAAGSNGEVVLYAEFADGIAPGTEEPVTYKASNASETDLFVTSVNVESITTDPATCLATDFSITDVLVPGTVVPASTDAADAVTVGSSTLVFANDLLISQDTCKGAEITLTLSSN